MSAADWFAPGDGVERRYADFRVAGRTLSGRALVYGDVAPQFRERFVPGAFQDLPSTMAVNLQHDASLVVVDAMLADGPRSLDVRADLPEGSAVIDLVRRGALRGFSIEFRALQERAEAGVRVIEQAVLTGLAVVDRPAYPGSVAEVRAGRDGRRRLWL